MAKAETSRFNHNFPAYLLADAACAKYSPKFAARNTQIIDLVRDGCNCGEIGKVFGLSRARVGQIVRDLGLKTAPRKTEVNCSWCRKPLSVFRSALKYRKNFFCSISCSAAHRVTRETNATCLACGKGIVRSASQVRGRTFCSPACYHSIRQNQPGNYVPHRQGQRKARAVVAQHFDLKPENVVHHEDRDNRNNAPSNLRVFRNQSDHMAYHHGSNVLPIWDGRKVAL